MRLGTWRKVAFVQSLLTHCLTTTGPGREYRARQTPTLTDSRASLPPPSSGHRRQILVLYKIRDTV
jgi:hypothetical protein